MRERFGYGATTVKIWQRKVYFVVW
jgi:hypothetical protein